MNIYEKMQTICNEIGVVNKNLEVGVGKSGYKAVGEADVLKAVKELEKKYKIYSYPYERKIVEAQILSTKKEYDGKITEGTQQFMRIETVYRFINIENPEEFIDVKSYGDGIDPQDKAPGKAMTYADKYALLKAYKIITGDDPDQNPSEEQNWKGKAAKTFNTVQEALEYKITFGKYNGTALKELITKDKEYSNWLLENGDDTIKNALKIILDAIKKKNEETEGGK